MIVPEVLCALSLCVTAATGADLHVSPLGNDASSGTREAPVATLTGARDCVRRMKREGGLPSGGVTVWIHGGSYSLTEGFRLSTEDSGTAERPVSYRAAPGEEVRLAGGRKLPAGSFRPVTEAALADRIPAEARGYVLRADLKALGITELGRYPKAFQEAPAVSELFFNDRRMTLARWPNDDWARIAKVVESGPAPWRGHASDKLGVFEYEGDRPSRWTKASGVWLEGYWCFDWRSETIQAGAIDASARRITLSQQHCYGIGGGNPAPRRYYAVNLLEELDRPGEYFIDRQDGSLFFWPPGPLTEGRVVLSTLNIPVILLENASHVTLRGLTVETCVDSGIRVSGGQANRILACCVRNTGQSGIVVDEGNRHQVVACDVYDTGKLGIQIGGGDRKTLTPSGHAAVNNHIYRPSRRQRTYAGHIHLSGVGVRVAHNLLHDGPHMALGLSGNDHVIEFNDIHHIGMECDDCGAFYMGRNPSERGNVLRYNYWHEVGSTLTHGSCAVYFDDGTGGQKVHGNVFYRAAGGSFGAVFVHGGHDNIVTNNVFVECKRAVGHVPWNDAHWTEWVKGNLWQERLLKEVDITRPPYADRYPDLQGFIANPTGRPRVNFASRNVAVRCGDFSKGNWDLKDNFVTESDPGFVDFGKGDFRLRDNCEVFQKVPGFERIPFDRIGLYCDELRPTLPSP